MAEEMPSRRDPSSAIRTTLKWSTRVVLVLALMVGLAIAELNTPIGKRWIVGQIADVAPASGLLVEVGSIEGDIYGEARLTDVVLRDPQGVFLRLDNVELDWHPLAWFGGRLDIDTLIARRGRLLRLPELRAGDPDAPILPDFDIDIHRFVIEQLTLGPGIVGDTSPIIDFAAQVDIREGRAFVDANGKLGPRDRFAFVLDSEPDADRFDIDLDYAAPQGGVLAGLVGVDRSYTAKIDGRGSWTRWNGDLTVRRAGRRFANIDISNRSGLLTLKGLIRPQDTVRGLPARALGQRVSVGAVGRFADNVFDGGLALRGQGIRAKGAGIIDLSTNETRNFAIDAVLRDPNLLSQGVTLTDATLRGTIDGPFRDLAIAHVFQAARIEALDSQLTDIRQTGTLRFDGTRWTLPLDARIASVDTGRGAIDGKLRGGVLAGTLTLNGAQLASDSLRIDFPDAQADVTLRADLAAERYRLAGPVDVQDLKLDNLGRLSGDGRIDLDVQGRGVWALKSSFDARLRDVSNRTLANLAGPEIRGSGVVSIGSGSPIDFRNTTIVARELTVMLDGTIARATTTLAGRGMHREYGAFTVEGSLNDRGPTAELVFASPLPAAGLQDVRVAISPMEEGFDIETAGQSAFGAFTGTLDLFAPENGPTRVDIERLNVWRTAVTGTLTLADGGAAGALTLAGGGLDGTIDLSR
ncbi:MAG: DUF490 domain-containing protein, partial [Pontixanthobacter sp.]